jgi:hypothetical protein
MPRPGEPVNFSESGGNWMEINFGIEEFRIL